MIEVICFIWLNIYYVAKLLEFLEGTLFLFDTSLDHLVHWRRNPNFLVIVITIINIYLLHARHYTYMTLFSLLRLNNDSMRILFPYYRHEQERVEKINNLKKTTQIFVKIWIQDHVSPTSDLSFWLLSAYYSKWIWSPMP